MKQARKYEFAEAFDGGTQQRADENLEEARITWQAQTDQMVAEAFERGKQEAIAGLEAQILEQMGGVINALGGFTQAQEDMVRAVTAESIGVAEIAATRIADTLIARAPGRLVAETVLNALPLVIGEARIVVRLAPDIVDHIKSRMDEMAMEAGFTGKVVLLGDDRIAAGDCRIEWANGGIERCAADIAENIGAAINAFLDEHDMQQASPTETQSAEAAPQGADHADIPDDISPIESTAP